MQKYIITSIIAIFTSSAFASIVSGPIFNPDNNHTYYLLSESDWTTAQSEATSMGGNLAIINNSTENDWIFSVFGNYDGFSRRLWIGLTDSVTEGTFSWTDGSPVTYTNWFADQPDNANGIEDYAHLDGFTDLHPAKWGDLPNVKLGTYGVVEVSPVPEPTSIGVSIAVFLLAIVATRRIKSRTRRCS